MNVIGVHRIEPDEALQVETVERELASEEELLATRLQVARTQGQTLCTRVQKLVQAVRAAGASAPELARLDGAFAVPVLDVSAPISAALRARREAAEARGRLHKQIERALAEHVSALVALKMRLAETECRIARDVPAPRPLMPQVQPERRAHPRVRLEAAVDFASEDNFWSGFSMDVSEGGLFIATAATAPRGTKVSLGFTLPDGLRIEAEGEVRWIREYNERTPLLFPGVGIQFTRIDPMALAAVRRFAEVREPLFYVD